MVSNLYACSEHEAFCDTIHITAFFFNTRICYYFVLCYSNIHPRFTESHTLPQMLASNAQHLADVPKGEDDSHDRIGHDT
jgi:hypothetical protein